MINPSSEFFKTAELDEILVRVSPSSRMKTQHTCVVKMGYPYQDFVEFYERVLKKLLYKSYKSEVEDALSEEDSQRSVESIMRGVCDTYLQVTSDDLWENFLLSTVSSGPVEDFESKQVEICYTNDSDLELRVNKIPHYDMQSQEDMKKVLQMEFPFDKKYIYFLKQRVCFDGRWETHYFLHLPKNTLA